MGFRMPEKIALNVDQFVGSGSIFMPSVLRAQQLTPISVSVALRIANYLPVWIAEQKGIFAKHGLKADISAAASIAEPVAILNAERAQFAITGTGMAVNSTVEGAKMKVIAKLAGAIGLWAIGKPGTKVSSLNDLKGKSIASLRFPSNTVSSPTYAMKSVGKFDPAKENVRFLEGPPGSIIPAVRDGRADIGCVFEWDASIAEQQGLEVLFSFVDILGPIAFTSAMVREEYAQKNPKIVQSFCNALAESMKLIRSDEKVYAEVAAKEFSQVPPAAIAAGSKRLLAAKGVVPLNPVLSKAEWDAIIAHELGAGTMRKALPFEEIVDNSFATKAAG